MGSAICPALRSCCALERVLEEVADDPAALKFRGEGDVLPAQRDAAALLFRMKEMAQTSCADALHLPMKWTRPTARLTTSSPMSSYSAVSPAPNAPTGSSSATGCSTSSILTIPARSEFRLCSTLRKGLM